MKLKYIASDERDGTMALLRRTVCHIFLDWFIINKFVLSSCFHIMRDVLVHPQLLPHPIHKMLEMEQLSNNLYSLTITPRAGRGLQG